MNYFYYVVIQVLLLAVLNQKVTRTYFLLITDLGKRKLKEATGSVCDCAGGSCVGNLQEDVESHEKDVPMDDKPEAPTPVENDGPTHVDLAWVLAYLGISESKYRKHVLDKHLFTLPLKSRRKFFSREIVVALHERKKQSGLDYKNLPLLINDRQ